MAASVSARKATGKRKEKKPKVAPLLFPPFARRGSVLIVLVKQLVQRDDSLPRYAVEPVFEADHIDLAIAFLQGFNREPLPPGMIATVWPVGEPIPDRYTLVEEGTL